MVYDLSSYNNAVVGVVKDTISKLDQRISKSDSDGAILTMATDAGFNAVNTSNTDVLTHGQYLITGHNGAGVGLQSTEIGGQYTSRIGREWKIANTGNVSSIQLKFDGFDEKYVLLTDSDGDFSTGASEIAFLNSNGEITLSNLTNNSYITLANSDEDTDSDGVYNDSDIDDDNDGILDVYEQEVSDGLTVAKAFTSLGMARNVTSAGTYFFNLSGTAFNTYVDENGYVLVAKSFGGDSAGNLPQTAALTNNSRGILTPTILASLTDMHTVRIFGTGTGIPLVDASSTNNTLLQRVQNNTALHRGLIDNGINDNWTGTAAGVITLDATCTNNQNTMLHQMVVHTCGNGDGMHWVPNLGYVNITNANQAENLGLFVYAAAVPYGIVNNAVDTDADGVFDHLDLDSDNDGIPDNIEAQTTIGFIAPTGTDTDGDGLDNAYDTDNGGTAIIPLNTDGTDAPDYKDLDSDNDGVFDIVESGSGLTDANADGKTDGTVGINGLDNTLDNGDTFADVNGSFDNSQTDNFTDTDSDVNSGGDVDFRDADSDNDGVNDDIDIDDDNDGILDIVECCSTNVALNKTTYGVVTTPGYPTSNAVDGNTNTYWEGSTSSSPASFLEVELGGNGSEFRIGSIRVIFYFADTRYYQYNVQASLDGVEWTQIAAKTDTSQSTAAGVTFVFPNAIIARYFRVYPTYNSANTNAHIIEFEAFERLFEDEDGIINSLDLDSDNDGIPDNIEAQTTIGYIAPTGTDTDGDGLDDAYDTDNGGTAIILLNTDGTGAPDYLELDSDNDGIPDNIEAQTTIGYIAPTGTDTDGDGLDNAYDTDNGGTAIIPLNTDGTDAPDYKDLDSDNDGVFDIVESGSGLTDANADGKTDGTVGINGLDNTLDNGDTFADVNGSFDNSQTDNFTDTDSDVNSGGDVDFRDADSDNDGVNDAIDIDDDNDGILDVHEQEASDGLTVATAFKNLGSARVVSTAGVYFFNLSGTAFSSYVDIDGYVLVALDFGNGEGPLPQGTALDNNVRGILNPTVLASLTAANKIKLLAANTKPGVVIPEVNATTINSTLLQRIQSNLPLSYGSADEIINNDWIGTGAAALTVNSSSSQSPGDLTLDSFIFNRSGRTAAYSGGLLWVPDSFVQNLGGIINDSDRMSLWVRAASVDSDSDSDGIINSLDLDSDNDGIPDNIEAQSTIGYIAPTGIDTDGDGLDNAYDTDNGGTAITPLNTDGVDNLDFLDLDTDNDGVFDIVESGSGLTDANADGKTDGVVGGNGLDNLLDNGDTFADVNGNFDNSQTDNFSDVDNDVNTGGDVDYRDADADNDGHDNNIDIDDDNDGIIDIDELDVNNGSTAAKAFTSLGMARSAGSAGVYFFNLSGTTFSTYVDANGYVQIAISFGNATTQNLPQSTALTNATKGILTPGALASLVDATEIRINGKRTVSNGADQIIDVTSANSTLLQRIRDNQTLHKGLPDNVLNDSWTGTLPIAITANATCDGSASSGTALHQNIVHICGVTGGMHWIPSAGLVRIFFTDGNVAATDAFQLWVRADQVTLEIIDANKDTDGDGIINSLDLDSDNDGVLDALEGQSSFGYIAPTGTDTDGDGLDDAYDPDQGGTRIFPVNTDGVDEADFLDLDADNDGIPDVIEAQTTRGYIAPVYEVNRGNGIDNAFVSTTGGSLITPINTDATGLPDYRDLDSDNDGVFDIVESGSGLTQVNGMVNTDVGVNGFVNSLELADTYADVNGNFDATQTDNFTDTDADVLTFGDVDYRDAFLSGIAMITQVYQSETDNWIEITNVHPSNAIEANAIQLSLFSNSVGDQTGFIPTASYSYPGVLVSGASVLLRNSAATIGNVNATATVVSNNALTSFAGANDIFVLTSETNNLAYQRRYDAISNIANSSSYVRNDAILNPVKDFSLEQWTVFVDNGLNPDSNPPERHVQAPLLSEIAIANTAANIQLGMHRIGVTTRSGEAWTNGFPDRSRQVIIDGNLEQSEPLNAKGLQVNTGANLSITNNLLVVSNALVNNGTLRMVGTSQLIQTHVNTANVTGTGTLYIDQTSQTASIYRYDYWSSPVVENGETTYRIGQVMKDGTTPTSAASTLTNINFVGGYNSANTSPISIASYWLYSYTNGAWNATGNTGALNSGEGYLLKGPGVVQNYTFSGVPNDGTITTGITENTSKLVGNPYPSALDATKFIQDNTAVIDGSLYFWEHTGEARTSTETEGHNKGGYQGGYATRNITMGVAATAITGTDGLGSASYRVPGRYIAVGQGFFVGATSTGSLTFRNSQRSYQTIDGSNSIFFKGSKIQTTTLPILKIGLDYTNTKQVKLHRQIGISFKEGNTYGHESGYDSEIYDLNTQDDDIYWEFGTEKKYVIAGVEAFNIALEIPIVLQIKSETPVTIRLDAFENIQGSICLFDAVTNSYTDLKKSTGVQLNLAKGTYNSRFYLSFKEATLNLDTYNTSSDIQLYYSKDTGSLNIESQQDVLKRITIYNLLGQQYKQWIVKPKGKKKLAFTMRDIPLGVYMVKVETITKDVTKKLIIY